MASTNRARKRQRYSGVSVLESLPPPTTYTPSKKEQEKLRRKRTLVSSANKRDAPPPKEEPANEDDESSSDDDESSSDSSNNEMTPTPPAASKEKADDEEKTLGAIADAVFAKEYESESLELLEDLSSAQRRKIAKWKGFSTIGAMRESLRKSLAQTVNETLVDVPMEDLRDVWQMWHLYSATRRKEVARDYGYSTIAAFEDFLTMQQAEAQSCSNGNIEMGPHYPWKQNLL